MELTPEPLPINSPKPTEMTAGMNHHNRSHDLRIGTTSKSITPVATPTLNVQSPVPSLVNRIFEKNRVKYKPRSSIPHDLSSLNYASQCIIAAESCLMTPYSLSLGEYVYLRTRLPYIHVTTYLNIRNGILRLWLSNPLVAVTAVEAAGCCRDARYFKLAEFAYEFLVRNGRINQGCCIHQPISAPDMPDVDLDRKPRQTIVVVGAGIAGLCCARQLENLLQRYSDVILQEYEDIPRVIVIEGRKRIGGRVYSPQLSTENIGVDLGGDTITGFGRGNPLSIVLRRQLGIPVVPIDTNDKSCMYDGNTGDKMDPAVDYRAHELFLHLLDRMRTYEMGFGRSGTQQKASGSKSLMKAGMDPLPDANLEKTTIAQEEESKDKQQLDEPTAVDDDDGNNDEDDLTEFRKEIEFLKNLGLQQSCNDSQHQHLKLNAEPPTHNASLGKTIHKFIQYLINLADFSEKDLQALNWYLAKFEYQIGDALNEASLSSWSHHKDLRFTGRHAWTRNGMSALAKGLDTIPSKLDVRLKTIATVIEYDEDSAQITLENGDRLRADRVVITTPLGCLKQRQIQFIPDLPQWKTDSIDRLAVGCVNKVVLVFDKVFWDDDTPSIIKVANDDPNSTIQGPFCSPIRGDCFVFQNHSKRHPGMQKGLVIGLMSGEAASRMPYETDNDIITRAVAKLKRIFRDNENTNSAKLVESIVTRWQVDRFARGAYSHIGVEGTATDHDLLGRPVMQSLMFAGEATSRYYPGTIHGAFLSGLRVTKEVINSLIGNIEVPDKLIMDDEDVKEFLNSENNNMGAMNVNNMAMNNMNMNNMNMNNMNMGINGLQNLGNMGLNLNNMANPMNGINMNMNMNMDMDIANSMSTSLSSSNINMNSNNIMRPSPPGDMMSRSVPGSSTDLKSLDPLDVPKLEEELKTLRQYHQAVANEKLQRAMLHELGERPTKPDRNGTANPFLLFQKDYWEICRQETEDQKQKDKKTGQQHASRNEIRASLGKKWRSLPEAERKPYVERTHQFKQENEERYEAYLRKLKWYEAESANFKQRWLQDHPPLPSTRERQIEEQLSNLVPKKRKANLRE